MIPFCMATRFMSFSHAVFLRYRNHLMYSSHLWLDASLETPNTLWISSGDLISSIANSGIGQSRVAAN